MFTQWRAEAVGCPGPTTILDALKIFSFFGLFVPQNFSQPFFSHSPKFVQFVS